MNQKAEPTRGNLSCPDGRISEPTRLRGRQRIVDVDTYIPYFLTAVNNALSSGASALYLKEYGIGIVDWRVVSMLAIEPKIPASRVCKVVSLDKGAVSRSLRKLLELDYLSFSASKRDDRKKNWSLNAKGYALHDSILDRALERERQLIDGADPDDLEAFLRVMRIMRRNVEKLV